MEREPRAPTCECPPSLCRDLAQTGALIPRDLSPMQAMEMNGTKLAGSILLMPLVYVALLCLNASAPVSWNIPLPAWAPFSSWAAERDLAHAKLTMAELLPGPALTQLREKGIACVSDPQSNFCVTTGRVRIVAGPARSPTVYLAEGQQLPGARREKTVQPYARKNDIRAMARTAPVEILAESGPPCDVEYSAAAVVFSTGGYAGNFFHDVNDVIIPLFLTAGRFRRARFVASDYQYFWGSKYRRVLERLAGDSRGTPVVVASSATWPVERKVHCFPAAVVGLKYHGSLACNASESPGGITIQDFRLFLRNALRLPRNPPAVARPLLVLLSRNGSRALLNEAEVAETTRELGFQVDLAGTEKMRGPAEELAKVVAGAVVLAGVHGAGLTNMVYLKDGAVLVQVVPWGLDWAAAEYYGRPAAAMGLQYLEYKVGVEESTLSEQYPPGDPVLVDPWGVNRLGYNVSGPIFTDGQKLRLNLTRFRETLLEALRRVRQESQ